MTEVILFLAIAGLGVALIALAMKVTDIEKTIESLKEDNQKLAQNVYLNNLTERAIIKVLETKQNKEVTVEEETED